MNYIKRLWLKVMGLRQPINFVPEMQSKLDAFFETMYSSRGLQYEPEGCHQDLRNIAVIYQVNGGGFWVLQDVDLIIGTIGLKILDRNNGIGEVKRIAVLPNYQGRGYGKKLLNHLLAVAKTNSLTILRLDTMKSLAKALNLYYHLGFYEIERYNDNFRAEVFMELKL
jgi:ribosomal protein S18 acetylase RimI-like enzyme